MRLKITASDLSESAFFSADKERKALPAVRRKSNGNKASMVEGSNVIGLESYHHPILALVKQKELLVDSKYFDFSDTTHCHELDFVRYLQKLGYLIQNVDEFNFLCQVKSAVA